MESAKATATTTQPLPNLPTEPSAACSTPSRSSGRKATGLPGAWNNHAYVPLRAKSTAPTKAGTSPRANRRNSAYALQPATSSRIMRKYTWPSGRTVSKVGGKRAADCISPAKGAPTPS